MNEDSLMAVVMTQVIPYREAISEMDLPRHSIQYSVASCLAEERAAVWTLSVILLQIASFLKPSK